ncbi:MAG TPA: RodZ domain-containing protein, partial [Gammaproteobacteria bacterium]
GKRLQEARLNAGLSRESVAESLRLDPKFVVALEQEDADALPAATYTRGYIRAYAQLVRCNAEELIAQYNVHADGEPDLTDIMASAIEKPESNSPQTFWISFVVIGALIALLAFWAYDGLRPLVRQAVNPAEEPGQTQSLASPAASNETTMSEPGLSDTPEAISPDTTRTIGDADVQEVRQSDVPDNMLSDSQAGAGESVEQAAGTESNPVAEEPAAAGSQTVVEIDDEVTFDGEAATTAGQSGNEVAPVAPRGSDVLRLTFSGRSWAEVVDANGFQLAYGMFENRTLNFEGQAPFRVMLGDATQVNVMVNNDQVNLKPYIRWNKTANLSVGKPANSSD